MIDISDNGHIKVRWNPISKPWDRNVYLYYSKFWIEMIDENTYFTYKPKIESDFIKMDDDLINRDVKLLPVIGISRFGIEYGLLSNEDWISKVSRLVGLFESEIYNFAELADFSLDNYIAIAEKNEQNSRLKRNLEYIHNTENNYTQANKMLLKVEEMYQELMTKKRELKESGKYFGIKAAAGITPEMLELRCLQLELKRELKNIRGARV
jgi:hypothetical protein